MATRKDLLREDLEKLGFRVSFRNRKGKLYVNAVEVDGEHGAESGTLKVSQLTAAVKKHFRFAQSTSGTYVRPVDITFRLNPDLDYQVRDTGGGIVQDGRISQGELKELVDVHERYELNDQIYVRNPIWNDYVRLSLDEADRLDNWD